MKHLANIYIDIIVAVMFIQNKQDCPAHIAVKANDDGTALEVRSVSSEHNHLVSKVITMDRVEQWTGASCYHMLGFF